MRLCGNLSLHPRLTFIGRNNSFCSGPRIRKTGGSFGGYDCCSVRIPIGLTCAFVVGSIRLNICTNPTLSFSLFKGVGARGRGISVRFNRAGRTSLGAFSLNIGINLHISCDHCFFSIDTLYNALSHHTVRHRNRSSLCRGGIALSLKCVFQWVFVAPTCQGQSSPSLSFEQEGSVFLSMGC